MIRFLLALLALAAAAVPAAAQPLQVRPNNIPAELVAETRTPAAGQGVTLAFSFAPRPAWHGYWLNPGEAGMPARVEWTLPPGVTAGALQYPVPQPLTILGLMNYAYEGPHAVLARLEIPAGLAAGP